ncbi:MAG: TM2 domain-containing protein [Dehalococcoidales bacterium]|nr:TM2 domain-containing protein [Dehalococcoidales bacterium]
MKKLPRTVKAELPTLAPEAQKKFLEIYNKKKKSYPVALLMVLLYGMHYVYLEESSSGIWFWFTGGVFGILWIVDFFRVKGMTKDFNSYVALKAIAEVRPVELKPHF